MNSKNCYLENIVLSVMIGLLLFNLLVFTLLTSNITIGQEISLSDFINILIAIIVSVIVPITIGKTLETNKSSRELLLFEINNFLVSLDDFYEFIDTSVNEKGDMADEILDIHIPNIGNQYEIILESITTHFKKIDSSRFQDLFVDFRSVTTDDLRKDDFEFNSFYKKQCLKIKLKLQKELERLKFNII